MNILVIIILSLVAVIDLGLVYLRQPTISQRYQAMFPAYMDIFILCLLVPGICVLAVSVPLKVVLGVLLGHVLFPNKELYR